MNTELSLRTQTVKQKLGVSSLAPELKTQGSCTCPICGRRGKGYVYSDTYFKCYSSFCGAKGDVIDLYRLLHGSSLTEGYWEALKELEIQAGIQPVKIKEELNTRSKFLAKVVDIYSSILLADRTGKVARDYLLNRGFNLLTLDFHKIGYAPDANTLRSYGFSETELRQHNLMGGVTTEYYQNRVIFPIRDITGNYVHLVGRHIGPVPTDDKGDDILPRYKDSKPTQLGSTKNYLAFEHEISTYQKRGRIIITEGYLDALTLIEYGLPAVGLLGLEALTKQASKLAGFTEIICLFDNDKFADDHPNFPGEYKSWRRLLPQLIELQCLMPKTMFYTISIPEGQAKDITDWRLQNKEVSVNKLLADKVDITTSAIVKYGSQLSEHMQLIRLIQSTGRGAELLSPYIHTLNPIEYALRIVS